MGTLQLRGTLRGHNGWVTQITTNPKYPDMILSASRDKSLIVWKLTRDDSDNYGVPQKRLHGHGHFVSDVVLSSDGHFALSGSWDKTLRLWDLTNNANPIIVSCGWDKYVKVWNLQNCKLKTNHIGHTGYLNTVTMSPDGSLCASGGKDAKAMLWDLNDGKHLYTLDHADTINALCFSPNRYWLCAATGPSIKIWDLESKNMVEELKPEVPGNSSKAGPPQCLSMAWSADGQTLFAGYSDNQIRVWQVSISSTR